MLFRLLGNSKDAVIYTFACIQEHISPSLYKAGFEDQSVILFTKERLDVNDWIRFYGKEENGEVKCEYIELLNGYDINLIVKYLKQNS